MPTIAQRLEKDYQDIAKLRVRMATEIARSIPGPAAEPIRQGLREVDRFFSQGEATLFEVLKGIDKTLGFGGPS